ncbi:hypothetical protein ACWCQL_23680 [Streptomyces sp. NPDC002073]
MFAAKGGANQQWQLVPAGSVGSGGGSSATRFMGSSTVLIGGSMSDASATAAPFDVRYAYVHSQPAPSSDYYSASKCQDAWKSWWGCWSGSTTAPGTYVTWWDSHAAQATYKGSPRPQKFFWTWCSARPRGSGRLGRRSGGGRGHHPRDCGSQENSAAGLSRCLIAMAHKYAPNTAVGFHLSCWDWQNNTRGCTEGYANLGARNADFLVADVSDRDAGRYAQPAHGGHDNFWTDRKAAASLGFYKTMAESVGKPVVLWQIPVGNWRRTTPSTITRTTRWTGSSRTWTRWRTRMSWAFCSVQDSKNRHRSRPMAET